MSDKYRFSKPEDSEENYSDGTIVPHRLQYIERFDGTTWGYLLAC